MLNLKGGTFKDHQFFYNNWFCNIFCQKNNEFLQKCIQFFRFKRKSDLAKIYMYYEVGSTGYYSGFIFSVLRILFYLSGIPHY